MTTQTEPGNMAAYPGQNPTPATTGNGMAIAGLLLAFLPIVNIVGLVLSIIGLRAARREKRSPVIGILGVVISSVTIVISLITVVIMVVVLSYAVAQCGDLGPGTHLVDGVTYTCG